MNWYGFRLDESLFTVTKNDDPNSLELGFFVTGNEGKMRIFISGGCKNGKSYHAQHLAKEQSQGGKLYYVATMLPADNEDEERIKRHRAEREGWGFVTVEQPVDVEEILLTCDPEGSFLLDSLTAWLANEMFPRDGGINEYAVSKVTEGLDKILRHIGNIVIVSDYIYSDAMFYDSLTEKYRKFLAEVDKTAARLCDLVLEVAYTNVITHKSNM